MYELIYWCWRRQQWLRVEGPDYASKAAAQWAADNLARRTGRQIRILDDYGRMV